MKIQMPRNRRHRATSDDQALPLINIAFLLLVFFLLAGTLLPPSPISVNDLELLDGMPARGVPEGLLIARDGRLAFRGVIITREDVVPELFVGLKGPLAVQADALADAQLVIDLLHLLARAGVVEVELIGAERLAL